MKIICSLLMAVCCALSYTACAEDVKEAPPLQEAKKSVTEGKAIVLDVREKEAYNKGHLAGARNIPLSDLKTGNIPDDLPKDKPLYTHCMEGTRAKEAAEILNKKGYDAQAMVVKYDDLTKAFDQVK